MIFIWSTLETTKPTKKIFQRKGNTVGKRRKIDKVNSNARTYDFKVPKSYWNSMENRRTFLDSIAAKYNIKKPSDWGKLKIGVIYENGGTTLMKNYYNDSLFVCLQSVYKGQSSYKISYD